MGESGIPRPSPLLRLVSAKVVILPGEVGWPATANATTAVLLASGRLRSLVEQHLWQSPNDTGTAGYRPSGRSSPDRPADARQRPAGSAEAAAQADHGQPSRLAGRAPNLLDQDFTATGPDKKWGADISYVDPRRLVVPRGCHRPVRSSGRRLGNRRPVASGPGSVCSAQIPDHASSGSRAGPPFRPWQPVLLDRLSH